MTWTGGPGRWTACATLAGGLAAWRYHGRLIARQLDDTRIVIRADFDYRDWLLR